MRVVQVTRFGDPEVLVLSEAPDPVAGPGQVVIDVSVADVLFIDTQIRSGWGAEYFAVKSPYVPGAGVAGEVISVGEGVDSSWVGRRVVTDTREAIGRPLRFEEIPPEDARQQMLAEGWPPQVVDGMLDAYAAMARVPEPVTTTVEEVTGRPASTFRKWAIDHADDFR